MEKNFIFQFEDELTDIEKDSIIQASGDMSLSKSFTGSILVEVVIALTPLTIIFIKEIIIKRIDNKKFKEFTCELNGKKIQTKGMNTSEIKHLLDTIVKHFE